MAPRNPGVSAWDDLAAGPAPLYARMQEVFAGFMTHTDAQMGRLVDFLDAPGCARRHPHRAHVGQRGERRGRRARDRERVPLVPQAPRLDRGDRRAARRARRTEHAQSLPDGVGAGWKHPTPVLQASRVRRRCAGALHRELARGHAGPTRRAWAVPPRDRHDADHPRGCVASTPRSSSGGSTSSPSTGHRCCAPSRSGTSHPRGAVLRDRRVPRDRGRRVEGDRRPPPR